MSETVGEWLDVIEGGYPERHATGWDNVGLQVGARDWPVERVLVALDVTSDVVAEAAEGPPTLLAAHHPLFFRPLSSLTPASAAGRIGLAAARASVAVTAAHTNLDVARDGAGTSQPVVDLLGLREVRALRAEPAVGRRCKLVTFVPPEAVESVIDAVSAAGAGRIGEYERCSFRVRGTGTFRPLPGSQPYSGEGIGHDAAEDEFRLEVELDRAAAGAAIAALHTAHPYDEAAYDLFDLLDGAEVGLGLLGELDAALPLATLAERVRAELPAPHLRYAGVPDRLVRRVAVVGGAGDSMIGAALAAAADVLVTGDLRHHVTLDALEQGLSLVDAGHHATEVAAMPAWRDRLAELAAGAGLDAPVVVSQRPTVPWR